MYRQPATWQRWGVGFTGLECCFMRIYVGNLNFRTTEDDLRAAFEAHGEVEETVILTDRVTGRSRGFAFVSMPDETQASEAIEAFNGQEFEGRVLKVNEARERTERPRGDGRRSGYGKPRSGYSNIESV